MDSDVEETRVLLLYGTSACHLCEQAEELLEELLAVNRAARYRKVDISTDDALFERYGWVIPVIVRPDGEELCWPFDRTRLREFIG